MNVYVLQIIENFGGGRIKNKKICCSIKEAKEWFKNQPKSINYGHGYEVITIT